MHDQATMLKIAYLRGLVSASDGEPEMIKEALIGKALGWLGRKLLYSPAVRAAAKPGVAAKGLRGFLGLLPKGEMVSGARGLLPEAGRFAKNLVGFGTKPAMAAGKAIPHTGMSSMYHALTLGGRAVPSSMLQFGALGGVAGGLTGGQPGKRWSWSGAGKGLLGGAAGGLGWELGGRMVRGGLGRMLGSKAIAPGGRLARFAGRGNRVWGLGAKQPGFWGRSIGAEMPGTTFSQIGKQLKSGLSKPGMKGVGGSMKDLGTKALLGAPIAGGILGGSMLAESAANSAMGKPARAALAPEAWARRSYYTMTPGGRGAYYG